MAFVCSVGVQFLLKEFSLIYRLDFIIKDKKYIEFSKYKQFGQFATELNEHVKSISGQLSSTQTLNPSSWSEEEVNNWFKNKKIKDLIIKRLVPCDGGLLEQLYQMLVTAPEFFHSILSSDSSLKETLFFSAELKKLFSIK